MFPCCHRAGYIITHKSHHQKFGYKSRNGAVSASVSHPGQNDLQKRFFGGVSSNTGIHPKARKQTSRIPGNLMSKFQIKENIDQTGKVDELIGAVERLMGKMSNNQEDPRDVVLKGMTNEFRQTLVQTIETGMSNATINSSRICSC